MSHSEAVPLRDVALIGALQCPKAKAAEVITFDLSAVFTDDDSICQGQLNTDW